MKEKQKVSGIFNPLYAKSIFAFLLLLFSGQVLLAGENLTVKGQVLNEKKESVPMANIVIKGTNKGITSDMDGNYSIEVPSSDAILEFSFIGYITQEIKVGNRTLINVTLKEDATTLDEVVVTAMGIERKASSLTYSTDIVKGSELTRAKETNLINSLQGKSAGLIITPNSTGAGGSSKILLRGNKSASGNNQPLIVIDGIPMSNPSTAQQTSEFEGRDGGDAISNLNPDDIASINILKGASAAALYGSMAANGVILITTKKGKEGAVKVDFSSSTTFETLLLTPKLQKKYGAVVTGNQLGTESWGPEVTGDKGGANRIDDFYRTGSTFVNSISINGGTEKSQGYLSYANTTANGIVPTNDFMRHNMTVRQSFQLFNNILSVEGSVNYIKQHGNNRPHGGSYYNPLTGVYSFPVNGDFNYYKENYETYNNELRYPVQNWYTELNDFAQNPYWILHRNKTNESRDRVIVSGTARLRLTDFLNIQGRISLDKSNDLWERRVHATTVAVLSEPNGRYRRETLEATQYYGDAMLNFNKTFFDKFEISASAGASFLDFKTDKTDINSDKLGLIIPNFFVPENILGNGNRSVEAPRKRLNSVFGTAQLGYRKMLYLDVTGRNDWSSTLAFTNNMSYFYPSFGLTGVLNEMFNLPESVDLLKVRASYSIVGNDMPVYITNRRDKFSLGNVESNTKAPFAEMKPEKIHSMEFGFDFSLFKNRINFDFTYYKTNSKNQFFEIDVPDGSFFEKAYINTGDIQNSGIETSISFRQNISSNLHWSTGFNLSYNDNKVKELDPRLGNYVSIGSGAGFRFILKEGGSYGDIYTRKLQYDDQGNIALDDKGTPKVGSDYEYVGNVNSKWSLGWHNTFTYKDISLYFLIDGKIGGQTVSMTQSMLDKYGVTKTTGDARDNGGVDIGNGKKVDAKTYYSKVAGRDGAGDQYTYNATNFRLREFSLGYTFKDLFGYNRNLGLSFVARNLFFLYKDSPNDPDVSMSTANGFQSFDIFGLPATRSFGINLKLNF